MNAFTTTARSQAKRRHDRASYDETAVFAALDAAFVAHIGYVIDGQPYVTPTAYWRTGRKLYWHGSSASRMVRSQAGGVPVCVTVTQLDGLVMARSGFNHSLNYRSVMAFGTAHIVEDTDEKLRELDRFIDRLYPNRRACLRANEPQEIRATTVIGMEIEEAAVKVRSGGPKDDAPDYDLDCWAGVIPIHQVIGAPVADPDRKKDIAYPADLNAYRSGEALHAVLLKMTKNLG
jgi:nitroimidazol reductase NimA-like FMN-containing flavoprotein (pyridoxamine 5'-phosphate oxidase superfamily)